MDILRTHPMVILGGVLQRNPFFVPPAEFLAELREAEPTAPAKQPWPSPKTSNQPSTCVNIATGASTDFTVENFSCQNVRGASAVNGSSGAQYTITGVTGFQDAINNPAGSNFLKGVAIGGEQVSKAPRMVWAGFVTGNVNGVGNLGPVFTPDQPITITRFTIFQQTTGTCTTFPTISIFAGSALSSIVTSTTQTLENSGSFYQRSRRNPDDDQDYRRCYMLRKSSERQRVGRVPDAVAVLRAFLRTI